MRASSSADPAPVSVIVVTWNGAHLLGPCLDSILAERVAGRAPEIIVVDNGSDDDTAALLATRYPSVRVVALPANLGFAGGANAGLAAATATTIVFLNNDAHVLPGFLAALHAALAADDTIGAATARIDLGGRYSPSATPADLRGHDGRWWRLDDSGAELVNSTGNLLTRTGNGLDRDWLVPAARLDRPSGPVPGFSGGAVALRRAALVDVGEFSADLFMYFEDSELSWRLRSRGWRIVYVADAVAVHRHAASSGVHSPFFVFHTTRNRLLVALRLLPAPLVAVAWTRGVGSAARASLRRSADRRTRWRAVRSAVRLAPRSWRMRRAIDRRASVPRRVLARDLVPDPR